MEDRIVLHNGEEFRLSTLIKLIEKARDLTSAYPIIISLLLNAYELRDDDLVNQMKRYIQSWDKPVVKLQSPASNNNMPKMSEDIELWRKKYRNFNDEQKIELFKESLCEILRENKRLFDKQKCWIGIFLVIRDRLDGKLKASSFHELAEKITPDEVPEKLRISTKTMSNMSRSIKPKDKNEAYYDMEENPFTELCDKYWDIVRDRILTNF